MYYSNEMIFQKLERVERLLNSMLEREAVNSIEEISLNKACKKLHMGRERVIKAVEDKELVAMKYVDSNGNVRYRFRVSDIYDYQRLRAQAKLQETTMEIRPERAEDIFKRAFNRKS